MEGMYPAVILVLLAFCAVWWFVRTRDAIALKRVVRDLKEHQTAEADRAIAAFRMALSPHRKAKAKTPEPRSSDYARDSNEG